MSDEAEVTGCLYQGLHAYEEKKLLEIDDAVINLRQYSSRPLWTSRSDANNQRFVYLRTVNNPETLVEFREDDFFKLSSKEILALLK